MNEFTLVKVLSTQTWVFSTTIGNFRHNLDWIASVPFSGEIPICQGFSTKNKELKHAKIIVSFSGWKSHNNLV